MDDVRRETVLVAKIDPALLCPICQDVLDDPVCCRRGHNFCRTCIETWLDGSRTNRMFRSGSATCPIDREATVRRDLNDSLIARNLVGRLESRCSESECGWTGPLERHRRHVDVDCSHTVVPCLFQGCLHRCPRAERDEHESSCDYRPVDCEQCGFTTRWCEKAEHVERRCPSTASVVQVSSGGRREPRSGGSPRMHLHAPPVSLLNACVRACERACVRACE